MKVVKPGQQIEITGSLEKLADTIALGRAEAEGYNNEMFTQMTPGDWLTPVPDETYIGLVRGIGLELLNDDGTPASPDTVVRLGQLVWEKLQAIAEMGLEEEELPLDTPTWP
jgi:hypothetical protein